MGQRVDPEQSEVTLLSSTTPRHPLIYQQKRLEELATSLNTHRAFFPPLPTRSVDCRDAQPRRAELQRAREDCGIPWSSLRSPWSIRIASIHGPDTFSTPTSSNRRQSSRLSTHSPLGRLAARIRSVDGSRQHLKDLHSCSS